MVALLQVVMYALNLFLKIAIKYNMSNFIRIILLCIVGMHCVPTIHANDKENCNVHIYLTNKENFEYLYINEGEQFIYEDTIGLDSNVFIYKCLEPKLFSIIINNNPSHLIPIYLHPGNVSIYINIGTNEYYFTNSKLNSLNKTMIEKEDSLRKKDTIPTPFEMYLLTNSNANINRDSLFLKLSHFEYNRAMMKYRYYRKNPDSFLALNFVWVELQPRDINKTKNKLLFSKNKLNKILKKIPDTFKNYNKYKECVTLFKKSKTRNLKPLWNENGLH